MKTRIQVSVAIFLRTFINPALSPILNGPRSSLRDMKFATTGKAWPENMVFMSV